jgi:hypothetical protein
MAYLGQVDRKASNVQVFNVTSSTSATHSIGWTPPSEQTLIVTINGVKQHTNAFSFSGSTLTLGAALVATDELEVIGINDIGNSLTPVDNSVTTSKLGDNSVTLAKMAGGTDGNLITYDASGDPAHVATGSATHILTSNGAGAAPTFQAPAAGGKFDSYAVICDQKTAGSNGGAFTSGSWQTRELNTEITDIDGIVSISSNEFVLSTGSYLLKWSAPACQVNMHQTRLYDVTGTASIISGSSENAEATMAGYPAVDNKVATKSIGFARVTVGAGVTNNYKIEHRCSSTRADHGLGVGGNFGELERFTMVEIYKES